MGTVTIKFNTDNEAFEEDGEVARILKQAASKIPKWEEDGVFIASLFDTNGNKVGSVTVDN